MSDENTNPPPDEPRYEWQWIVDVDPDDIEECEAHYRVWTRARDEWQRRRRMRTLDDEAQRQLITEVAESLPEPGGGEALVVASTSLSIAKQLLESKNERNAFLDYVQFVWAHSAVAASALESGFNLWVDVDLGSEEEVEDDDEYRLFSSFDAVIVTPSQDDDILTVKTACAELGIAVPTFHNHIQRKRGTPEAVPVIKLRGRYVLYRRQFEAWRRKHYHPKFAPKTSSAASKRTTTKDDDHQTP